MTLMALSFPHSFPYLLTGWNDENQTDLRYHMVKKAEPPTA